MSEDDEAEGSARVGERQPADSMSVGFIGVAAYQAERAKARLDALRGSDSEIELAHREVDALATLVLYVLANHNVQVDNFGAVASLPKDFVRIVDARSILRDQTLSWNFDTLIASTHLWRLEHESELTSTANALQDQIQRIDLPRLPKLPSFEGATPKGPRPFRSLQDFLDALTHSPRSSSSDNIKTSWTRAATALKPVSDARTPNPPPLPAVSMYVDTDDRVAQRQIERAVLELANLLTGSDIEDIADEIRSKRGSLSKQWFSRSARKEAKKAVEKASSYAENATLGKQEAELTAKYADACANLVDAFKDTDAACVLVGNLVFVKSTDPSTGQTLVIQHKLTHEQMRIVERTPTLLAEPHRLWSALQLEQQILMDDSDGDAPDERQPISS